MACELFGTWVGDVTLLFVTGVPTGLPVLFVLVDTLVQEMWGEIIEKLDEAEQHQEALSVGRNSFDDADDEPFDPTEFIDEDDEF